MHRFYLPPDECRNSLLTLRDREAHHAVQVMRIAPGERVAVLDGAGHELLCEAVELSRDTATLRVVQRDFTPPLPCRITLLQAVPKARIMEDIIQKAVELGVHRIVPLLSDRVVTHLDARGVEAKAAKWRLTAIEAIKQCGSAWLPPIDVPLAPKAFVARHDAFELPLIASLQDDRRHPREHLEAFVKTHGRLPTSVCVWVGPEGDFTPAEQHLAKSAGALPISLGPLVLRCETAALFCLSVLNYELQAPRHAPGSRA